MIKSFRDRYSLRVRKNKKKSVKVVFR